VDILFADLMPDPYVLAMIEPCDLTTFRLAIFRWLFAVQTWSHIMHLHRQCRFCASTSGLFPRFLSPCVGWNSLTTSRCDSSTRKRQPFRIGAVL